MKTIKKIFISALAIISFISCDKGGEEVIFDGNNGQTLISFRKTVEDLPIVIDDEGSVEIILDVTTRSSSDRTFEVEILSDESTANPDSYSFNSTVTIPANEYNAILTINGVDNDVEITPETLVLRIIEQDSFITTSNNNTTTVNVFQICPVEDTLFVGNYLIEQITPFIAGPTLSSGTVVELIVEEGSTPARKFNTLNYPNFCSVNNPFTLNLVCNEVVVPRQEGNCSCDGNYFFDVASVNAVYDLNDDSEFLMTFTDDSDSDCGSPVQTTYRFTKQ
ncbi:hypothetical protein [Aquimarina rhabdastrellae]